jgi:phosphatidylglycerophosphate synthase
MIEEFSYVKTLKTRSEREFINFQMYLLVTSRTITKWLYYTPVTPHQVILFSLILGVVSSVLIIQESKLLVIIGSIFLFYKNVFDKVDGSLARAKGLVSRRGRFYDSITDFIVSFCLFAAMGYKLYSVYDNYLVYIICFAALISSMLQCSFFIFYDVSYIKFSGKETINRITEEITSDDLLKEEKFTLLLQRIFLVIYGWQDKLMAKLDKYFYNKLKEARVHNEVQAQQLDSIWYYHRTFLALASILGIGTHIVLIAVSALIGRFDYYIVLNLILLNLLLIFAIVYHYASVKSRLKIN